MARIYCPECGTQLSSEAVHCPNCGFPIAEELQKTRVLEPSEEEEPNAEPVGSQKKRLSYLEILGGASLLLLLAFTVYSQFFVQRPDSDALLPPIDTTTATLQELEAAVYSKCFPQEDPPDVAHRCPEEARVFFRCILEKDECYGEEGTCREAEEAMMLCIRCRLVEEYGKKGMTEEQCGPYWGSE